MRRSSILGTYGLALAALVLALLTALPSAVQAASPCAGVPSLGDAADCGLFMVGPKKISMKISSKQPDRDVEARICMAAGASLKLEANLDGDIRHDDPAKINANFADPNKATITGTIDEIDMSPRVADAIAFSEALSDMAPTQTFGDVNADLTITSTGLINVIEMNKLELEAGEQLTLTALSSDDFFIINVDGDIKFKGPEQKVLLSGGTSADHVVFNITEPGKSIKIEDGASTNGTLVTASGKASIKSGGTHTGPIIAGSGLKVKAALEITGPAWAGCNIICPSPELSGITSVNIQTPATQGTRTTQNADFYYASFDSETWEGHLEALRLASDGTLIDANSDPVIDPNTNLLDPNRVPHWDAGTVLQSNASRTMYTTVGGARVTFDNTNVTIAGLGIVPLEYLNYPNSELSGIDTDAELRDAIIEWTRGKDAFDEDSDLDFTEMQPFVLRDIFRSNPLFVGSPGTHLKGEAGYNDFYTDHLQRKRRLYAGSNGAALHAFHAGNYWDGVDPNAFDPGTGAEVFAYVPGLLLDRVKVGPVNSFRTQFYVDGPVVAADAWLGDGSGTDITKTKNEWATVLISAFRTGGRGYLALDVSDPNALSDPNNPHYPYPKLLWEFSHARLGESWSKPVITRVKIRGATSTGDKCGANDGDGDCREEWVAIFGGGYERDGDPNEAKYISDPNSASWSDRSKAIFMVGLESGTVVANVEYDQTGTNGPAEMKYSIPSAPAVLDTDADGFADVVYIGDVGGQLWKWDISAVGENTAGDARIDNWGAKRFFVTSPSASTLFGLPQYKSMYAPPNAAFVDGKLKLAFGTGERNDLAYWGDPNVDDNNRLYVITDPVPTGSSSLPGSPYDESSLTNVTSAKTASVTATGFYFVATEGEKFVNEINIFGGQVLATSYDADAWPTCGGDPFLYIFRLSNAAGYFDTSMTTALQGRRVSIGNGISSGARMSLSYDAKDDVIYITTSEGEVIKIDPPDRDALDLVYWRQQY